jgi:hypothetical protein
VCVRVRIRFEVKVPAVVFLLFSSSLVVNSHDKLESVLLSALLPSRLPFSLFFPAQIASNPSPTLPVLVHLQPSHAGASNL